MTMIVRLRNSGNSDRLPRLRNVKGTRRFPCAVQNIWAYAGGRAYGISWPPFTSMIWPVMYPDSVGEARKR
jgi:hypothetical protein